MPFDGLDASPGIPEALRIRRPFAKLQNRIVAFTSSKETLLFRDLIERPELAGR